ncbi:hypothetical protein A2U01_0064469, partial [Trifolium medium]|nr:hypothetical protein [Trifolium medium]
DSPLIDGDGSWLICTSQHLWRTCTNECGGAVAGFAGTVETMHGQAHYATPHKIPALLVQPRKTG